jgi:hypothetical protein
MSDCCQPQYYTLHGRSGLNGPGLCGNGPGEIPSQSDWVEFSHRCIILRDGTLWCTGETPGDGTIRRGNRAKEYIRLPDRNWSKVLDTGDTIYALKNDGTLWGWGSNRHSLLLDAYADDGASLSFRAKLSSSVEGLVHVDGVAEVASFAGQDDKLYRLWPSTASRTPLTAQQMNQTTVEVKQVKITGSSRGVDADFAGDDAVVEPVFAYTIYATDSDAGITSIVIEDGGQGYSFPPDVSVTLSDGGMWYGGNPPQLKAVITNGVVTAIEGRYSDRVHFTGGVSIELSGGDPVRPAVVRNERRSSHMAMPRLVSGGSGYTLSDDREIDVKFTFPSGATQWNGPVRLFSGVIREAGVTSIELLTPRPPSDAPSRMKSGRVRFYPLNVPRPETLDEAYFLFTDGTTSDAYVTQDGQWWYPSSNESGHTALPKVVWTSTIPPTGEVHGSNVHLLIAGKDVLARWNGENCTGAVLTWTGVPEGITLETSGASIPNDAYGNFCKGTVTDVVKVYGENPPNTGLPHFNPASWPEPVRANEVGVTYTPAPSSMPLEQNIKNAEFEDGPKSIKPEAEVFFFSECASPARGRIVYDDKGYAESVQVIDPGAGFRREPSADKAVWMGMLEPFQIPCGGKTFDDVFVSSYPTTPYGVYFLGKDGSYYYIFSGKLCKVPQMVRTYVSNVKSFAGDGLVYNRLDGFPPDSSFGPLGPSAASPGMIYQQNQIHALSIQRRFRGADNRTFPTEGPHHPNRFPLAGFDYRCLAGLSLAAIASLLDPPAIPYAATRATTLFPAAIRQVPHGWSVTSPVLGGETTFGLNGGTVLAGTDTPITDEEAAELSFAVVARKFTGSVQMEWEVVTENVTANVFDFNAPPGTPPGEFQCPKKSMRFKDISAAFSVSDAGQKTVRPTNGTPKLVGYTSGGWEVLGGECHKFTSGVGVFGEDAPEVLATPDYSGFQRLFDASIYDYDIDRIADECGYFPEDYDGFKMIYSGGVTDVSGITYQSYGGYGTYSYRPAGDEISGISFINNKTSGGPRKTHTVSEEAARSYVEKINEYCDIPNYFGFLVYFGWGTTPNNQPGWLPAPEPQEGLPRPNYLHIPQSLNLSYSWTVEEKFAEDVDWSSFPSGSVMYSQEVIRGRWQPFRLPAGVSGGGQAWTVGGPSLIPDLKRTCDTMGFIDIPPHPTPPSNPSRPAIVFGLASRHLRTVTQGQCSPRPLQPLPPPPPPPAGGGGAPANPGAGN